MDFLIDNKGELIIEEKNLNICEGEKAKVQAAYCICKSISNDWFIDKLGADLEEIIGLPNNKFSKDIGEKKIINSLSSIYDSNDIYVEAVQENNIMEYTVYLKTEDGFSSNKFKITIDLLGYGISIDRKDCA